MHKRILALLLAAALLLSGCAGRQEKYQFQFFDTFDTVVTLTVYAGSEKQAEEWNTLAHARFLALHQLFDRFREYAGVVNIATLNRTAATAPVAVSEELFAFLSFCVARCGETDGQVNIAFGAVTDVWHALIEEYAGRTDGTLADPALLEAGAAHTSIENLVLDADAHTVFYADAGLLLDVGAVAKGYAAQRVADDLSAAGCSSFLISAGGNIVAGGAPAVRGRNAWSVGLQNPDSATGDTETLLGVAHLSDQSMVTSGDYQRYYLTAEGQRIHHIIDPDTRYPAVYFRSVTVIAADSGTADALSTALFCMEQAQGAAVAQRFGAGVIWVFADGSVVVNEAAQALFEESGAES